MASWFDDSRLDDAEAALHDEGYSIVLLDLGLPDADGLVLLKSSRREGSETPVLVITGDADVATLEHSVAMFRLLGGGDMGDMGQPLPASRLAVMPATSHTAVITQTDMLISFIEPFLAGETPKGMFAQ